MPLRPTKAFQPGHSLVARLNRRPGGSETAGRRWNKDLEYIANLANPRADYALVRDSEGTITLED